MLESFEREKILLQYFLLVQTAFLIKNLFINPMGYSQPVIEEYVIEEFFILEEAIEEIEFLEGVSIDDYSLRYATAEDIQNIEGTDWGEYAKNFAVGAGFFVATASITLATGGATLPVLMGIAAKDLAIGTAGAVAGAAVNVILEIIKTGKIDRDTIIKNAADGATVGIKVASVVNLTPSLATRISKFKASYSVSKSGKTINNIKKSEILSKKQIINKNGKIMNIPLKNRIFTDKYRLKYYTKGKNVIDCKSHEIIGILDKNKNIINKGQLVGKINNKNILEAGLQESLNKGLKLKPDLTISQKIVRRGGKVYILDDDGNTLASIENSEINKGIRYIFELEKKDGIVKQRIMGQIDKKGEFIPDWRKNLTKKRNSLIKSFRNEIKDEIKNGTSGINKLMKEGRIHPDTSKKALDEWVKTGKGMQVHHINNVATYPDLAGDPRNLILTDRATHKKLHGGNFRNPTSGQLTDCQEATDTYNSMR